MGQLSLKKLVELTGYADSRFVSVSSDSYGLGSEKEKLNKTGKEQKEQNAADGFSHRRALRVV